MEIPETLGHILNSRLYDYVPESDSLGALMISTDLNSTIAAWDIGFNSNMEAVLFQMSFLATIADHLHSIFGVGFSVSENKIIAHVPDDSGIIVTPTTEVGESQILPYPGHYKGLIKIKWENIPPDIGNGIRARFTSLLKAASTESKKI